MTICRAALLIWFVAAVGSAHAAPATVTDGLGRIVTIPAPPKRIVTIFASNTEIAVALGLSDRIVGIESYTRYPPEIVKKPLVGGRLGFSVDAIVAQEPDLVVVTPSRQAANQLIDPMERLHVPVLVLLQRTVDEILSNIRLLAKVADVSERGERVVSEYQGRLQKVQTAIEGRPRPRVVMITGQVGNGLILITRPSTYTGDAISVAGASFALADATTIPQVSPESILNSNPDVLLFSGTQAGLDELIKQPGWGELRAVTTGHAYTLPRAEFLIPGPRTINGIERLAALLHPDAFPK